MAKPGKDRDRAERVEAMRRATARAERRRTLIVVGICGVVALAIVAATGWKLYSDSQRADEVASTDLAAIGASADSASCLEAVTEPAAGSAQHVDREQVDYPDAPPAFGAHWSNPAAFQRKLYTADDRPEVEELVHNLEHGYTILWYDETVADDAEQMRVVEDVAAKFDVGTPDDLDTYNANKFIAAPWTADDGESFPDGAHVAMTRWAAEGDDAAEGQGLGAWQYCEEPSGEAVEQFMADYPQANALEPDGQ